MKKKQILTSVASLLLVAPIASCANSNDSSWSYSREDTSSFLEAEGYLSSGSQENELVYEVALPDDTFNKSLEKSDVLFFDYSKVVDSIDEDENFEYITYDLLKKNSVSFDKIESNLTKGDFTITFKDGEPGSYGALINKTALTANEYMLVTPGAMYASGGQTDPQKEFEKKMAKAKFTYSDGGKLIIDILCNVGSILGGVATSNPAAIISGTFNLLNSIAGNLCPSGPTLADVMDKLKEMDAKLDQIKATMDANHNQLMQETVRTQAAVDQVILNQMEAAITDFNDHYVKPVNDYKRNLSDYYQQCYVSFVKQAQDVDMWLKQNSEGFWTLARPNAVDEMNMIKYTVHINGFPSSKAFLKEHNDTFGSGFMDCLTEDVEASLANLVLLDGMNLDQCRDFVLTAVNANYTQKYYVDNHDKATEIRNLAIDYSQRISGKLGSSVINNYVNRLMYIYNFAGEMKEPCTGLIAKLKNDLYNVVSLAADACDYAKVSVDELKSELETSSKALTDVSDNIDALKNGYSTILKTNLTGSFYHAGYNIWYTEKGNHPCGHTEFSYSRVYADDAGHIYDDEDFIEKHTRIESGDHLRIAFRLKLLKELGLVASNTSYVEYLVNTGALERNGYRAYQILCGLKKINAAMACRFMTENFKTRDMNDGDKNVNMRCIEAGNPGGNYFNEWWTGTFRGGHKSSEWSGTIAEASFIDGLDGTMLGTQKVCAFAFYSEGHWYWKNDERWSFASDFNEGYFFVMEYDQF